MIKLFISLPSGKKEFKYRKKRSNLKKHMNKPDFFTNPEKYLEFKKENYSKEYIRQLKYIVKKYKKN